MDYRKMSDFEINAAVFEALHGGAPDYKEGDGGAMVLISYEGDVVGGDAVEVEVERGVFNPCNNAADAWPIIEGNGISIVKLGSDAWCADAKAFWVDGLEWQIDGELHKKPLRAAMVAFLKMQESANVQDNPA
ncbi:phage protein NinX family protein [Atlantibacter hermannii]|uniref:phage protein NinX family protein n=1 Tax=Atlantibacter hermannii TaxID=565 RepID=UPI0028A7451A|nr:phage protein NinX family protein [Atlantibacter hermannii]